MRQSRRARRAIGKFSALGLPHRRIEEWKYTDLRANLKEALPLASVTRRSSRSRSLIVALGPLAHVERLSGRRSSTAHRDELSMMSARRPDRTSARCLQTLRTAGDKVAAEPLIGAAEGMAPSQRSTARIMTDGAMVRVAEGAAWQNRCCSFSSEPELGRIRLLSATSSASGRGDSDDHGSARRAARRNAECSGQHSERGFRREGRDARSR